MKFMRVWAGRRRAPVQRRLLHRASGERVPRETGGVFRSTASSRRRISLGRFDTAPGTRMAQPVFSQGELIRRTGLPGFHKRSSLIYNGNAECVDAYMA